MYYDTLEYESFVAMPHLSSYRLQKDQLDQLSQRLVVAVSLIRERGPLAMFFNDLFTATERAMFGKRLLIALFLEDGRSYADISRVLRVGEQTIASISERLNRDGNGLRPILKKLAREEKITKLFDEISKSFNNLVKKLPTQVGSGRWRFFHSS